MSKHTFVFTTTLDADHGATTSGRHALGCYHPSPRSCFGPHGDCYSIPTLNFGGKPLPLYRVMPFVHEFLLYAQRCPLKAFFVPLFEDHTPAQIAPLFKDAPKNVLVPPVYGELL